MTTQDTKTADDPMATAKARRDAFADTLAGYDDPLVAEVADAVASTGVLEPTTVGLSVTEWLSVLETTAGSLYLSASSDRRDSDVRWLLRHDETGFVYATERYGEMYRGDPDATRQIRSVIEHHDVHPRPMDQYPVDTGGSFIEDATDDAGGGSA